jgi:hypothetical protein
MGLIPIQKYVPSSTDEQDFKYLPDNLDSWDDYFLSKEDFEILWNEDIEATLPMWKFDPCFKTAIEFMKIYDYNSGLYPFIEDLSENLETDSLKKAQLFVVYTLMCLFTPCKICDQYLFRNSVLTLFSDFEFLPPRRIFRCIIQFIKFIHKEQPNSKHPIFNPTLQKEKLTNVFRDVGNYQLNGKIHLHQMILMNIMISFRGVICTETIIDDITHSLNQLNEATVSFVRLTSKLPFLYLEAIILNIVASTNIDKDKRGRLAHYLFAKLPYLFRILSKRRLFRVFSIMYLHDASKLSDIIENKPWVDFNYYEYIQTKEDVKKIYNEFLEFQIVRSSELIDEIDKNLHSQKSNIVKFLVPPASMSETEIYKAIHGTETNPLTKSTSGIYSKKRCHNCNKIKNVMPLGF